MESLELALDAAELAEHADTTQGADRAARLAASMALVSIAEDVHAIREAYVGRAGVNTDA